MSTYETFETMLLHSASVSVSDSLASENRFHAILSDGNVEFPFYVELIDELDEYFSIRLSDMSRNPIYSVALTVLTANEIHSRFGSRLLGRELLFD